MNRLGARDRLGGEGTKWWGVRKGWGVTVALVFVLTGTACGGGEPRADAEGAEGASVSQGAEQARSEEGEHAALVGRRGEAMAEEGSEHARAEAAEHEGSEAAEHARAEAGEHAGAESGEHSGEGPEEHASGEEGEESGVYIPAEERWDTVRRGARLILSFDSRARAFVGRVENATSAPLCAVRVEVHLSTGVELGPTERVDLKPGESTEIRLPAPDGSFEAWTAHPEVGPCGGF